MMRPYNVRTIKPNQSTHLNEQCSGSTCDNRLPDETLDASLVRAALIQVSKANCHNRWTVCEHWPDCKSLLLRTTFQRFEEGPVPALTKLEAALTPRRNLSERHVYDQLSRHAADHGEMRLVGKLSSRRKEQDQACSFQCTGAQDMCTEAGRPT